MPNIFNKRVLTKFAKQVPAIASHLEKVEMKLNPGMETPFQMLIRSIVYQQLAYKAAKTIHDRLLDLIGDFTPHSVLSKTHEELKGVGLSRQKASYVQNVAMAFDKGGFLEKYSTVDSLSEHTSDEIIELFSEIKGVGEWTVQMYLIFSLGRLDVLAAKDLGVRKGVQVLYNLKDIPTPKQVEEIAKNWRPLETVGTYLAWRVLELE